MAVTYVRRDVWSLPSSEPWDPTIQGYAWAVGSMLERQPSDPTSWTYQAAIHGTHATPAQTGWNQCQHATWFFLPWHRMYLYYFERIVRAAVIAAGGPADWALPYWNYEKPSPSNSIPMAFRTPTMQNGSPNPLFVSARAAGINSGAQLPPDAVSSTAASALTAFTGTIPRGFGGDVTPPIHFGSSTGALENQPHNVIHDLVGGDGLMGDPDRAAEDPIFWLHHANIDRLWVNWLGAGEGRANPTNPAWLTQSYSFFDEHGNAVAMTAADVVDAAGQLDYEYADP